MDIFDTKECGIAIYKELLFKRNRSENADDWGEYNARCVDVANRLILMGENPETLYRMAD